MIRDKIETERYTLYLGDCLEAMALMPDDSVEAVITDPPYCSGGATESAKASATHQGLRTETIRSGRFKWFDSDNMTTAGLCELMRSVCVRVPVVDSGSILVFCDWRMIPMLAPSMESAGWRFRNIVVWDKGHFGCGTGFRPRHEMVIHLSKQSSVFYSRSVGNVLGVPRSKDKVHPTEKPVELIEQMVEVVSPKGGTILDQFMGSGTTGVAAMKLGRRFIGVEIDPTYFAIAAKRIAEAAEEPPLFKAAREAEQATLFEGAQ